MLDLDLFGTPAFLIDVGQDVYRFAALNQAKIDLNGWGASKVVGCTPAEMLSAGTAADLMRSLALCIERRHAVEFDEVLGEDQGSRTWSTVLTPIVDGSDRVVKVLGIGADVTEQRRLSQKVEREAREAHARLRDAIEILPEAIVFLDADNRFVLWNRRYSELYPGTADLLAPGVPLIDILKASVERGTTQEAVESPSEWIERRMQQLRHPNSAREEQFKDGRWMRYEERRTSDGGTISVRVDITDLKAREDGFRLAFQNNPMPMWIYDVRTLHFIDINDTMASIYGYTREQFRSMTLMEIRSDEEAERIRAFVAQRLDDGPVTGVWRHRKADGGSIDVEVFARKLQYQGRPAVIAAAVDVTERLEAEARILYLAQHDCLTGLCNRKVFVERLDALCRRPQHRDGGALVVYLDIDRFKEVNDRFGHNAGDELLCQVAARLMERSSPEDVVTRLGGDEFAILLSKQSHDGAADVATRLLKSLERPYALGDLEVFIGVTLGLAALVGDVDSGEEIIRRADTAHSICKTDARGTFRLFEPDMGHLIGYRRKLIGDLREAVEQDAFSIAYQPLIDLRTRGVVACEALLRWNHAERGSVSPTEFIPLAEDTGLIVDLGARVLLSACVEAASWPDDIRVAVNLSSVQFRSSAVLGAVTKALECSGLRPDRLEVEITETVLLDDNEPNRAVLHQLRALGVRIVLDDFGMGYSSLGYLQSFPIDKIKIDRSFTQELGRSRSAKAIVKAVISLARALKMTTTSEGVETVEQCTMLHRLGCSEAQGYLFSKPMSASANRDFMRNFNAGDDSCISSAA